MIKWALILVSGVESVRGVNDPQCKHNSGELCTIQTKAQVNKGSLEYDPARDEHDFSLLEDTNKIASHELFEGCKAGPEASFLEVRGGKKSPSAVHPQCVDAHEGSSDAQTAADGSITSTGFFEVTNTGMCCDTLPDGGMPADCSGGGVAANCCKKGGGKIICT